MNLLSVRKVISVHEIVPQSAERPSRDVSRKANTDLTNIIIIP